MAFNVRKHLIKVQGGRTYLPVAARLVWFREEHPDWGIETRPIHIDTENGVAVFEASVFDTNGRLMAKGTKMETKQGFHDYIEKAETGAIGRALAVCGFGTQFAPDLFEGGVVDSPVETRPRAAVAPREEGPAPAAGKQNCSNCGVGITSAQRDLSTQRFGAPLCPACQKQRNGRAPKAEAAVEAAE